MSETPNPVKVVLRHGIADPLEFELAPMEVAGLARMPVEDGIRWLLTRAVAPEGVVPACVATLADPYCVIEVRQGDTVRVLTRRQGIEQKNVQLKPPVQTIEIGIAKAQAGGRR